MEQNSREKFCHAPQLANILCSLYLVRTGAGGIGNRCMMLCNLLFLNVVCLMIERQCKLYSESEADRCVHAVHTSEVSA